LSSVVFRSIDTEQVKEAVQSYVARLRIQYPEVIKVVWFGSWVNGYPSPGSDVDLCLILSRSNKKPRDRISAYLPLGFPTGVDLLIYTEDEFERLEQVSPSLYQAIISGRIILD